MIDAKAEAVRCWTSDPCGAVDGEPGTAPYARDLVAARSMYAPWMAEALGYETAAGLDVLDVGCGQGIDLMRFAQAGATVTGLDLTPRHVELARLHLDALDLAGTVVEGDAERLPFPDASFDRVTSNGVLHHTPDFAAALREIRRVLRPGGDARLILYHRNSIHFWGAQQLQERLKGHRPLSRVERSNIGAHPLIRVYSRRRLRAALTNAGFGRASLTVHQFDPSDFALTHRLRRWLPQHLVDWLGARAGWFIAATAYR